MNRFLLAAAAAMSLLAACTTSSDPDAAPRPSTTAAAAADPASQLIVKTALSKDAAGIPAEIRIPSSVGEVTFRHQKHIADLGIKCVECHHQIDARKIETPHPEYLKSASVNCRRCHSESGKSNEKEKTKENPYTCSRCHHTNPTDIADETMSAKVVIHRQCWKCHAVGTGFEASKGCELCHSGKRSL